MHFELHAVAFESGEPVLRFLREHDSQMGLLWSDILRDLQNIANELHAGDETYPQIAVYSTSCGFFPGGMIAIESFDDLNGRRLILLTNCLENRLNDLLRTHS